MPNDAVKPTTFTGCQSTENDGQIISYSILQELNLFIDIFKQIFFILFIEFIYK